ncbi:phosphate ABC transporter permease subunit PstC [Fodinibacter luteus]|uniref:Phosphate transport system permease protein n=1 Tax=Fodinibacter luteus TaxID=552064 RepID=A0ABP8KNW4_9MICO
MSTISAGAGPSTTSRGLRPSPEPPTSLRSSRPRRAEKVAYGFLVVAAGVSILTTVGIVLSLLLPAIQFFREISVVEFLTGTSWTPRFQDAAFGVLPLITGTLWTTAIALALAIPVGLGAAIYLSEYASTRTRKVLKPTLELLAGVPSVVYGLFAVAFVGPVVLNEWLGIEVGTFSVLAAGLVLGVMIIPTVASLAEDAMSAVPRALREASYGLGANRMRTVLRVVFPAAISGIAASIVLGLSRAVGETMIVAMAAGSQAKMVTDPLEGGQTMTGFIASAALGDSVQGSLQYNTLFAVGLTLFLITLVINVISIRLVNRFREIY